MSLEGGAPGRPGKARNGPAIRGRWNLHFLSLTLVAALLLPVGLAVYERGVSWVLLLLVCLAATLAAQAMFMLVRRTPPSLDGIVVALSFALMLPAELPMWQAVLSLVFGVVLGEQIFGGRGRSFLNPAVVALGFLLFSFPGTILAPLGPSMTLAVLPGALLLIATGLISWRILVAAAGAVLLSSYGAGVTDPWLGLASGGLVFGAVFFACDPVGSASTNPGRWVYGALFGGLTVLLAGTAAALTTEAVIFATLLSSVLAPLIDQGVIAANAARRRRRHG
jgi:Na+-transporting NADH:ubiquinone oxidoreductase subunit B